MSELVWDIAKGPSTVDTLFIIGKKDVLAAENSTASIQTLLDSANSALQPFKEHVTGALLSNIVSSLSPGDSGDASSAAFVGTKSTENLPAKVSKLVVAAVPSVFSRHNSSSRPDAINDLVKKNLPGSGHAIILSLLEKAEDITATACAITKNFPHYSKKSSKNGSVDGPRKIVVHFVLPDVNLEAEVARVQIVAEAVRNTARLVDMPTSACLTDDMVDEAKKVAERLGITPLIIRGEELNAQGFGGLYGVGKAAIHPPALVVLSHKPEGATRTVCWVGKGIVYDTGGLSLKTPDGMVGMKRDMGGAAGMLFAFEAAVKRGLKDNLHVLLCLAENAIGPLAQRPDDIVTMYSGKTVEVNNTDAEGRLVVSDGIAYATKHLNPDIVVDMATLTGAQGIATGRRHAAIVCNDDVLEVAAVAAGKVSGDLVHPLLYIPEFFRQEFASSVADMKNAVKERMNAPCSCAAQFIGDHLAADYTGKWLHIDMAYPVVSGERATGYGVALLVTLFENY